MIRVVGEWKVLHIKKGSLLIDFPKPNKEVRYHSDLIKFLFNDIF